MFNDVGRTVFKDLNKLSFDYVPGKLVFRDAQMRRLFTLFRVILDSNISQNAFLTGGIGTGKTALSKRFCIDFQGLAHKKSKNLEYALVNCRHRTTEASVLLKILAHFDPRFPDRGFSITEMLEILRKHLEKRKTHLIIVLDEADVLIKKSGSNLIYNFSRFDEEKITGKSSISLILISQKNVLDLLDLSALSTFKRTNVIRFGKYTRDELHGIIEQRVALAFFPDTVESDVMDLISDIASEWGDSRYAIELLEKAGMLADEVKFDRVTAEQVRGAKAEIYSTVTESKLADLDLHKKLLLLAIARRLRDRAYATTGEVEKSYGVVCEEYEEKQYGHTQLWDNIKELNILGLIDAKKSGKGFAGKTTLISIPDIPTNVLEEKIIELIKK